MTERPAHQPRFPLTADMSEVLAAARQDRAEAIGRSFVRFSTLVGRVDLRWPARALIRLLEVQPSDRGSGAVQ